MQDLISPIIIHFQEFGMLYLILSPFIAIALFFIIRGILRHLKGSIQISMLQKNYNYGDTITGSFRLHAKKIIRGEDLSMHLIALQKKTTYSNGKRRTTWVEFTRFSTHIESGVTYDIGLRREYDIKLQIPTKQEIFGEQKLPDLGDGLLSKIAKYTLKNFKTQQYTWKLSIILQAEGIDISATKSLGITDRVGMNPQGQFPRDVV